MRGAVGLLAGAFPTFDKMPSLTAIELRNLQGLAGKLRLLTSLHIMEAAVGGCRGCLPAARCSNN